MYTLIAYMPNWDIVCRGHVVERGDSNFYFDTLLTKENLIQKLVEIDCWERPYVENINIIIFREGYLLYKDGCVQSYPLEEFYGYNESKYPINYQFIQQDIINEIEDIIKEKYYLLEERVKESKKREEKSKLILENAKRTADEELYNKLKKTLGL